MASFLKNRRSPAREGAIGFVLGAMGGCALGATVTPVNQAMTEIISGSLLKPVIDGVRTLGPLGLGTLLGATAISTSMTAAVAGVTVAASIALVLMRLKKHANGMSAIVWIATGLAAALGTTFCGATLGHVIEKHTIRYGVVALLWALGIITVLKTFIHIVVQLTFKEWECGGIWQLAQAEEKLEAIQTEQRERVAVEIEQRIIALETVKSTEEQNAPENRAAWEAQRQKRQEMDKLHKKDIELTLKQMTMQERLTKVITKYVEFLAFAGIPMTVTAAVTAGFGIFGFGDHRFVFVILLALILFIVFMLMKSEHLHFWMFTACMGMLATFAIAVLTVHAGQEVLEMSASMRKAGQALSREKITAMMGHMSSLEAIKAGFFMSKMCQIALGATVGGALDRKVLHKVTVGASVTAFAVLSIVEELSSSLGVGGVIGSLLGALGAAGVSLGAAASAAVQCSSWAGTLSTTFGILFGALVIGKWDFLNIGLQVLVAYMFSMIKPY